MRIVEQEHPRLYPESTFNRFFEIPPRAPNALEHVGKGIGGREYPRDALYKILRDFNSSIGNDALALQNIELVNKPESRFVIAGQQLGFMGGPSYTIFKAISCVLLARECNAIPLFWLATDDHDISEIDHTYLIDKQGNLKKFRLSLPKDGRPVEDLILSERSAEVIEEFFAYLGLTSEQQPSSLVGVSYSHFMARHISSLFRGTGLVFVEPHLLRPLAIPFFQKEIREQQAISEVLLGTTQQFEEAGGVPQVQIQAGPNLFLKTESGQRCKINVSSGQFSVGGQIFSEKELLSLVEGNPERFSTNVCSRPVLQSLIFPTLAYVAGPSEIQYYHQLKDYHNYHGVLMPWLVPRISATLLPLYATDQLGKCQIDPWTGIPANWMELMPSLQKDVVLLSEEWERKALKYFYQDISTPTLNRYIRQGVLKIQKKVCRERLHRRGIPFNALHYLRNLIQPHNKLQERVLNWNDFQAQTKENLIEEFLNKAEWQAEGHLWCFLN